MRDVDTGATTATLYDNRTVVTIGARDVYPFAWRMMSQWQWAPALPHETNANRVELTFTDREFDVMPTNAGQSYFVVPTSRRTRRMQGELVSGTLDAWVAQVEATNAGTMLHDSMSSVVDVDAFGNVLDVQVSTVGVDATMHVTRTVKNNVDRWMLGLPNTQTECSTATGLTLCRTITRTTNTFGEVEAEATSSSDGLKDTQLSVRYERDTYGNVPNVLADDAFGNHRASTTVYDDEGLFPTKHVNALGHETLVVYDPLLGVLTKETDPNGLSVERAFDGFARLEWESGP